MTVLGIDEITFGSNDLPGCRQFFLDWGLRLVAESPSLLQFESMNGCRVRVADSAMPGLPQGMEPDPTLREVVWGVPDRSSLEAIGQRMRPYPGFTESEDRVGCTDPNGLAVKVQVSRKRAVAVDCAKTNTWSDRQRLDQPASTYERAEPVEVGHVVLFVRDLESTSDFYQSVLGFVISDRYPGRGHFLRCAPRGGHHDLFLLRLPEPRAGLNHVAFTVRDHHEVFGGGMHMSRCGWKTQLGPGRHPISSAIFWYFHSPAGALVEYYADEDELTADWQARDFTPGPTVFAEWAITGGIDGNSRRQANAEAPSGAFLTEKAKT